VARCEGARPFGKKTRNKAVSSINVSITCRFLPDLVENLLRPQA